MPGTTEPTYRRLLSRSEGRAGLCGDSCGAVTLVALCLTTALSIGIASFLALCLRSSQFSARVINQKKVSQLAQIGLEEALWALNHNQWAASGPDGVTPWTVSGTQRTATLTYPPSNGGSSTVELTISGYSGAASLEPLIEATATLSLSGGETFTKRIRATTGPLPLFPNAIASAEEYVSFTAAGLVDSWNSDPDDDPDTPSHGYSFTAGEPSNYAAVVAGNDNGNYGVILGQATVRGYVTTFGQPVSYVTSGSPAGIIIGPATPSGIKVDTARIGKSAFIPVPTASFPPTSGPYYGGLLGVVNALLSILTGPKTPVNVYKWNGNLDVKDTILLAPNLTVTRPIKLIVDGNLTIADGLGNGKITITPQASLEIYVTGSVTIRGHGVHNVSKDPSKFAIFALGSSGGSVIIDTPKDFCGVVYSDDKPIEVRENLTITGALLSRRAIRFTNNATAPVIHYDSALRKARFDHVFTPYVITRVSDLSPY